MKIKVLGSTSPYSTNDRNGIGYLIESNNYRIMLDAGSGISKNLDMNKDLENLTIIISHLHRDHYAELLPLSYATYIMSKNNLLKNKIKVYIPDDIDSIDKAYVLSLEEDSYFEMIEYSKEDILSVGSMKVEFTESLHGVKTYSIKVSENDKSICYTSDTGYANNNIIPFANNTELLICETTYLKDQTKPKDVHLTTIEAGNLALKSNVKKLMINHFWPSISKEKYLEEVRNIFDNVIVAEEKEEFEI